MARPKKDSETVRDRGPGPDQARSLVCVDDPPEMSAALSASYPVAEPTEVDDGTTIAD